MLIDQAEMIISFIPTLPDGRAAISSGVERELQHAHEAAKEVYRHLAGKTTSVGLCHPDRDKTL